MVCIMKNKDEILNSIEQYIKQLPYPENPQGLYDPIKYVLSLGGKRIRPLLMIMAYNLYKEDTEKILPQAVALETYHNFTLLHDDLMDNADMRRGFQTVHKKWDSNTAILSGDAMLITAYKLFTENIYGFQPESQAKALKTFNDATLGVCDGQQYDVDFENRNDVREEEYMEMIRLKTSLLLACALKIGAELAGATDSDAENLYKFGEKIGLAFQLQDDLLDVYGDPSVFGKKIGGEIGRSRAHRLSPTGPAQLRAADRSTSVSLCPHSPERSFRHGVLTRISISSVKPIPNARSRV